MAIIHFIWWGPYRGEECVKTPNDVASKCRNHQIIYWCQGEAAEEFATHLSLSQGNMRWESCSRVEEIVGSTLYNGPNRKWYDNAQAVLIYLNSVKAYAAIKDLLSLIILHRYGGYYFDTTTLIPSDSAGIQLDKSLNQDVKGPRVVRLGNRIGYHQVLLQTARSIASGIDRTMAAEEDFGNPEKDFVYDVPLIDVWALYSPAKDPSFELMIMSYVSRCNRMGLYPDGAPSNLEKISGNDILRNNNPSFERNELLGNLIVRSVYDGLLVVCCDGEVGKLSNFCWKAQEIPADSQGTLGNYTVPELGINKRYLNTWRLLTLV